MTQCEYAKALGEKALGLDGELLDVETKHWVEQVLLPGWV